MAFLEWAVKIYNWIVENWRWALGLAIFLFAFIMVPGFKKFMSDLKNAFKEFLSPAGIASFAFLVIVMVIILFLIGVI